MSNSVVTLSSFNILFITQVLTVLTSTIKYNEYVTDKGENISIPCIADGNIMWVKENGSNNSTIIQTGKYLVLTNVSASDRGLYVCFAAVTSSSQSLDYDEQKDNNNTSLDLNDKQIEKDEIEQNDGDDDDNNNNDDNENDKNKQVLLTSTTTTTNTQQKHVNDIKRKTEITKTFVKPLIENNKNIKSQIETETQNASTTSMLPMPNVTTTITATATTTPKSTLLSNTASASATKTTTTTIVIKTLLTNTTTTTISSHDHPNSNNNNNTYLSLSSSNSQSNNNNNRSISSSDSSDNNLITFTPLSTSSSITTTSIDDIEEQEFQAFQKINLTVRTPPGPVTKLYFKASTILGFLVWRFNKTNSGGYPVRSFTAEFRNVSYVKPPFNSSFEHKWSRMDPINIAPNVRQMEVYRLEPNTTYEFRIWANNQLGSGEVVTTNVTTLPETKEEDLIRLIQPDLDNFDPRIWIVAVSIVLGTFVILAIGLCIVLTKECYQSSQAGTETNSICINNQNNKQKITYFNNRNDSSDISNNIVIVVDDNDDVDNNVANDNHDVNQQQQNQQKQQHQNHYHHQHIIVDVVDA